MSGWGNGIAKPWHERPQPTRIAQALADVGWSTRVGERAVAPRGRTLLNSVEILDPSGAVRGRALFREGSFVAGVFDRQDFRAQPLRGRMDRTGIRQRTPNEGLTSYIRTVQRVAREEQ